MMTHKIAVLVLGAVVLAAVAGIVNVSYQDGITGQASYVMKTYCQKPYPFIIELQPGMKVPDFENMIFPAWNQDGSMSNRFACTNDKLLKVRTPWPEPRYVTGTGKYN